MTVTCLPAREQTRARYPDETGYIERDGVNVFWERYGDGEPTILFLPDLDHHPLALLEGPAPVLRAPRPSVDIRPPRQRSLRSTERPRGIHQAEFAADAVAVIDQTGTEPHVVSSVGGRPTSPAPRG